MKQLYLAFCITMMSYSCAMNDTITIEPYQSERDYPAIEKILQTYPHISYEAVGYAKGTTKQSLENDNYHTDVLIYNNQTVGFVNYRIFKWYGLTFLFGQQALIHLIGVDQKHQNRGFGSQLLQHTLQKLEEQKISSVYLAVKATNINAQKLYEKEGFSCIFSEEIKRVIPEFVYKKSINTSMHFKMK